MIWVSVLAGVIGFAITYFLGPSPAVTSQAFQISDTGLINGIVISVDGSPACYWSNPFAGPVLDDAFVQWDDSDWGYAFENRNGVMAGSQAKPVSPIPGGGPYLILPFQIGESLKTGTGTEPPNSRYRPPQAERYAY